MNNSSDQTGLDCFLGALASFRSWFIDSALPLWSQHGVDHTNGGFFEKLSQSGLPIEEPRRTRVVARQIYVFCAAHRLGWRGEADDLVQHGLDFLLHKLRAPDMTFWAAVLPDGTVSDSTFDLYEQAFALFALASANRLSLGRGNAREEDALCTLDALRRGWSHPMGGFEESQPRTLPLKANPHMHMLEAALQWAESESAVDGIWGRLSDELAELAMARMIQRDSGLLTELFDGEWMPASGPDGTLVEPGHLFEWGWLLLRWGELRGRHDAMGAARKLIGLGDELGVDWARGVTINSMGTNGVWRDAGAKLWPQTERVKAWVQCALTAKSSTAREHALHRAAHAIDMVLRYLDHPVPGLWHEVQHANGEWSNEPVRASSLYHVVCALETACFAIDRLEQKT